jgi:REP element-mobilizing transposase RayT
MVRGIEGIPLFRDDQDRETFLRRIEKLIPSTGSRILAWTLMVNHVHLLMFSGNRGISTFMRCLLTSYALGFNRKYKRRGHLFQNRYQSIVCQEDTYLLELVRYIHLNPLRGGVVKSLRELDRYPWCGHGTLLGRDRRIIWQERDYVLRQFGEKEAEAVKAYRRYIEEGRDQGKRSDLGGGGSLRNPGGWSQVLSLRHRGGKEAHDTRILGEGEFVAAILQEADQQVKRQLGMGQEKEMIRWIMREVCQKEGVCEDALRQGSQRRKASWARARISYRLSREWGISLAEIARSLGVSTSAIANAIRKLESSE